VGAWEAIRDFILRKIIIKDLNIYRKEVRKCLEVDGFRIVNDNQNFMYAVRTKGRVHISDHFYTVYSKGCALICPGYELPFPFSYVLSKKLKIGAKEQGGITNKVIKKSPI